MAFTGNFAGKTRENPKNSLARFSANFEKLPKTTSEQNRETAATARRVYAGIGSASATAVTNRTNRISTSASADEALETDSDISTSVQASAADAIQASEIVMGAMRDLVIDKTNATGASTNSTLNSTAGRAGARIAGTVYISSSTGIIAGEENASIVSVAGRIGAISISGNLKEIATGRRAANGTKLDRVTANSPRAPSRSITAGV